MNLRTAYVAFQTTADPPLTVAGLLQLPQAKQPLPAVVICHGSDGVDGRGQVKHPDGGAGGGREVRHRDSSRGWAPERAQGRKIQARSTANRKTAAARFARVIATSSGSRAPGTTSCATRRPSVVNAKLTA